MRRAQRRRRALAFGAAALLMLAAAGCGRGGDFSGDPEVPEGYAVERQAAASFVRPEAFVAQESGGPEEAGIDLRWSDPQAEGERVPFVGFDYEPGEGDRFDARLRSLVDLYRALGQADVGAADVELAGAQAARRLDVESGEGDAKVKMAVLVVRHGDDLYQLSAGAPERASDALDRSAVIESFRLDGGS